MTLVTMVNSVDEHVAGEQYELDTETADRWILLGYANGDLSRTYSEEEHAAIEAASQGVSLGG